MSAELTALTEQITAANEVMTQAIAVIQTLKAQIAANSETAALPTLTISLEQTSAQLAAQINN